MRTSTRGAIFIPNASVPMEATKKTYGGFIKSERTARPQRLKYSIDEILGRGVENGEATESSPHDSNDQGERKALATGGHLCYS